MIIIRNLGLQPYQSVWQSMKSFTSERKVDTPDELWLLEHEAVYTQGQAGKSEHILDPKIISIIKTDRGGQITYHGPGQLVAYVLMDIRRRQISIRSFVSQLEQVIVNLLKYFNINAQIKSNAPGVYINDKKIASIGLRVKNGCTYHGIAININMDLTPFSHINPCGYAKMQMTQLSDYVPNPTVEDASKNFVDEFATIFGC
jgi:lipoyl(octanoyl) transferase